MGDSMKKKILSSILLAGLTLSSTNLFCAGLMSRIFDGNWAQKIDASSACFISTSLGISTFILLYTNWKKAGQIKQLKEVLKNCPELEELIEKNDELNFELKEMKEDIVRNINEAVARLERAKRDGKALSAGQEKILKGLKEEKAKIKTNGTKYLTLFALACAAIPAIWTGYKIMKSSNPSKTE